MCVIGVYGRVDICGHFAPVSQINSLLLRVQIENREETGWLVIGVRRAPQLKRLHGARQMARLQNKAKTHEYSGHRQPTKNTPQKTNAWHSAKTAGGNPKSIKRMINGWHLHQVAAAAQSESTGGTCNRSPPSQRPSRTHKKERAKKNQTLKRVRHYHKPGLQG